MKDVRSLYSEAQEVLKKWAVQAVLVLEGRTHQETAQLFGVARGTVIRWMGAYLLSINRIILRQRKVSSVSGKDS